jgi:hypothetical protein
MRGAAPAAAAATKSFFVDRVGSHVDEVVAAGPDDRSRNLELPAGPVAHTRTARDVARIMVGQRHVIVG